MDSGAPAGLFAKPLFGGSSSSPPSGPPTVDTMRLPIVQQHVSDVKFRFYLPFSISAETGWMREFTFHAPRAIEMDRPWAICITTVDVIQYTCGVPGAEVCIQLDAPGAGSCRLEHHPEVDVDYVLPPGPFNNILGVVVLSAPDPTQRGFTDIIQRILGRWGGHQTSSDAMAELQFDDDDKLVGAPKTSPLVHHARDNRVKLAGASRDEVSAFCKQIDDQVLQRARRMVYTCGSLAGRLIVLDHSKADCVTGSIMFQCRAKRIDMLEQRQPRP